MSSYTVDLRTMSRGYDRVTCWCLAMAGRIPAGPARPLTVVLTLQRLELQGSDVFQTINSTYTTDGGLTWSPPLPQENLARIQVGEREGDPIDKVPCGFCPMWHDKSGKLLATGGDAYYWRGKLVEGSQRSITYSIYDEATHTWSSLKRLDLPADCGFRSVVAAAAQRVDLENGEILLPVNFWGEEGQRISSVILRCAFDGETMTVLEVGDSLTIPVERGLYEPSLCLLDDTYYLTLRNDLGGYVTISKDGLHFETPRPWTFDDGSDLGSYNTQQHWVQHGDELYLTYTRRGANNDHVFRHRAPIFMARVDTENLAVLRDTETAIIPNRGARLGNFGITPISASEVWVTETEWMQNSGGYAQAMKEELLKKLPAEEVEQLWDTPYRCGMVEQFGADNSVWVAQIRWAGGAAE